jgi:hypothetical protein
LAYYGFLEAKFEKMCATAPDCVRRSLGTEDFEKCDFEGKRFLNVSPEIVSQLFQSLDPL